MTVAAVILAQSVEEALVPIDGLPRVRHVADAAWSGGAMPVVVVASDPAGALAAALGGSMAELVPPRTGDEEPAGQMVRGIEAAVNRVGETTAALVWPVQMAWVDAGTVTALIEAHPRDPQAVLRPAWRGAVGWPALVPVTQLAALRDLAPGLAGDAVLAHLAAARVASLVLELGDPGVRYDSATPRQALPAFEGPERPFSGHPPEWGANVEPLTPDG